MGGCIEQEYAIPLTLRKIAPPVWKRSSHPSGASGWALNQSSGKTIIQGSGNFYRQRFPLLSGNTIAPNSKVVLRQTLSEPILYTPFKHDLKLPADKPTGKINQFPVTDPAQMCCPLFDHVPR